MRWVRWGRPLVLVAFLRQCITEKVPPADFDSLRGERGRFVCCPVAPFRCGGQAGGFLWPFLGWWVTEEVYSLTAYPAGGHFLVRQKVTKERPGLRPGPDGQRRQSLGGRSPYAAWTAWVRFFCLGDSLNLIVWLLDAWLGGWFCGGTGSSGLAGGALWPAPSFRLA